MMTPPEKRIIAPSLLSSDFARLAEEANAILAEGADWLHVDVMDGHFVPNLTLGAPVVKCLRKHTKGFLDCHLMVTNPEKWVKDFAAAGADMFTFHIEATEGRTDENGCGMTDAVIRAVQEHGMQCGIAIKPKTPIETVFPYLDKVNMILVMTVWTEHTTYSGAACAPKHSVEPGFGGQGYQGEACERGRVVRERRPHLRVEVDGGIGPLTAAAAAREGADVFVAGSAIFGAKDRKGAIEAIRNAQ